MLKLTKSVSLTGVSMVEDKEVFRFSARIESANPSNMNLSYVVVNKPLHEANLAICRADQKEFEDYAYAMKNDMIAALNGAEEEVTANEEAI